MLNEELDSYDHIGVVLSQDAKGKFSAHRVAITAGKVEKLDVLTCDRSPSWALKEAMENLSRLVSDWQKQKISFKQPEQLNLFVQEHTKK